MDFEHVLTTLLELLDRERVRYAAMGGFAISALGIPRATQDIDFLVHRDDLPAFERIMAGLGYQRHHHSDDVSQYYHPQAAWGAIDIIHAFRHHSTEMLERATPHPIFDGAKTVKVLEAEDIIGLKVQAMANNPIRRSREAADIDTLASHYGSRLDWGRILEYYNLFELREEGQRLRERFDHDQ